MTNTANSNTLPKVAQMGDLYAFSVAEKHTRVKEERLGTQKHRLLAVKMAEVGTSKSHSTIREARKMWTIGWICRCHHSATAKLVIKKRKKMPLRKKVHVITPAGHHWRQHDSQLTDPDEEGMKNPYRAEVRWKITTCNSREALPML